MTRQEYISTPREKAYEAHRAYYAQFVTGFAKNRAREILKRFPDTKDKNFNDIPLNVFDAMFLHHPFETHKAMKAQGDALTMAGNTCIIKEAMRQILEEK